eukprot:5074120-Amphidinium_carterae.1
MRSSISLKSRAKVGTRVPGSTQVDRGPESPSCRGQWAKHGPQRLSQDTIDDGSPFQEEAEYAQSSWQCVTFRVCGSTCVAGSRVPLSVSLTSKACE